jgi:hypothetical protein
MTFHDVLDLLILAVVIFTGVRIMAALDDLAAAVTTLGTNASGLLTEVGLALTALTASGSASPQANVAIEAAVTSINTVAASLLSETATIAAALAPAPATPPASS